MIVLLPLLIQEIENFQSSTCFSLFGIYEAIYLAYFDVQFGILVRLVLQYCEVWLVMVRCCMSLKSSRVRQAIRLVDS